MTEKVAIFISGSGSNMVSLVNSMHKQNYARPSLVLSNKSCASGLTKAKNFNIPTVCIEPKKASGLDLDFEAEIQRELKNYKIEISKIKAKIGPTVTLYEIVPEAGVRTVSYTHLRAHETR